METAEAIEMGEERDARWYDEMFAASAAPSGYQAEDPRTASWYVVWQATANAAAKLVDLRSANVLDIGCGPGHVAEMLAPHVRSYVGLDFSIAALNMAWKRVPKAAFFEADVMRPSVIEKYAPTANLFIVTEFLEHVEHDLALIARLPRNAAAVFTVPTRDSDCHVRFFPTRMSALERYAACFDAFTFTPIVRGHEILWWMFAGRLR